MKKNSTVSYTAPIIRSAKITLTTVLMQSGGGKYDPTNSTEFLTPDGDEDLI